VERKKLVRKAAPLSKRWMRWLKWTGFRGMTVRDWLQLLIVPLALVVVGFLFTAQQDRRQQAIERERAQDLALQGYLDQMSTLVLEDLGNTKVRAVMRARTLATLDTLDPSRKPEVVRFLARAHLVQGANKGKERIALNDADMHDADLVNVDLTGAKLGEANLHGAELPQSFLADASLVDADLSDTNLRGADLQDADLQDADLSGAEGITNEELEQQAASLEGATMPNGQKYEDWLNSKGSKEDG
jgi:uncharacterized protein YjbI with pentapeptide repeats